MRTKTEEKRQAIIDVAAATFGELGFERTSMSEICTRLGGSKATLYNYFPSKEALFLEVMFQASEADFQNTMLALQTGNDDAAQTLRNFGQRFLGLLYSPEVMSVRRLLVSEGGRANIGQRCWDMGPARGNAAINAFLQQGIERRLLRNADTEVMRHHLLALLEAELLPRFMFQHLPAPTAQEIALCTERAVDAFMRVYGTPGDTQSKSDAIRKSL
ncbi:TetR/AcrR family transcriptional regulator [Comamonas thiooxydans]|uniref:TetR/AcrR family transcriptional regulator n=1 Tax=Comamonas thiooxydans TaxID=363952 RepID=UPI00070A5A8A|nr:TetR/AcrR family transcriptional regulator [Comamonas thiooxydans]